MTEEIDVNKDKGKLLNIFPEEIWLLISESLKDHDDVQNFSNSSLFFWNMLRRKRTVFLFPKAWKLFQSYFERTVFGAMALQMSTKAVTTINCESCGRKRFNMPYSEILNLRLVCRTWNQEMDAAYEPDSDWFDCEDEYDDPVDLHWTIQEFDSKTCDAAYFQQFYHHFQTTHNSGGTGRSPLLKGALAITHEYMDRIGDLIDPQPLFSEIPNFLTKYGNHISYCYIADVFDAPVVENYLRLRSWLSLMPNLETLELNIGPKNDGGGDYELDAPSQLELTDLDVEISLNPLPAIESLNFIKIRTCPATIFAELIRRNNHVTKLKILPNTFHECYEAASVQLSVRNVKLFSTVVRSQADFLRLAVPIALCPLTKLRLDIESDCIEWRRVFDILRVCQNTLTELALKIPEEDYEASPDNSPLRLKLRHVTRLKLTLPTFTGLDFLLPMKRALADLDLRVHKGSDETEMTALRESADIGNRVQFFSCVKTPMASNIWGIFTKLQCINYCELVQDDDDDTIFSVCLTWSHRRGDAPNVKSK